MFIIYFELKLSGYIVFSSPQQINAFVCLLNKNLKSKSNQFKLEVDLDEVVARLLECIQDEINFHMSRIERIEGAHNLMEVDSNEVNPNINASIFDLEKKTDQFINKLIL